jgi:glycosyltransferase involved in cell wall biosynthesis
MIMQKKILIFSLAYYPSNVSGAEAAIKEITDRISPSDIEFHLITLHFDASAPGTEKIGNVHVYRVGNGDGKFAKIAYLFQAASYAKQLHKKEQFTGLWGMMTYMSIPITFLRMLGVKLPYVMTLQDGDPYDKVFNRLSIKPFIPFIDKGFREARVFQVISEFLGTWPALRGYKGEVVLIRNGANPKNFEIGSSEEQLRKIKESVGKKDWEIYLFIAARLEHQKGIDNVIRALTELPPSVKFLIAGGGSEEQMLRDLTKELALEERVVFLGALERDDVPQYRNTVVSDIFVHPSRSEGLGNSVLSAMAGRLPVVATQVGGLADFIFDGADSGRPATAWAVPPDNPNAIAEAVKEIMNNPEEVAKRTEAARAMIEREYRWEHIASDMQTKVFSCL